MVRHGNKEKRYGIRNVWYEFIGALRLELYKNNFLLKWS
jgi:hypothetical protein